jgi:hypothetical protein
MYDNVNALPSARVDCVNYVAHFTVTVKCADSWHVMGSHVRSIISSHVLDPILYAGLQTQQPTGVNHKKTPLFQRSPTPRSPCISMVVQLHPSQMPPIQRIVAHIHNGASPPRPFRVPPLVRPNCVPLVFGRNLQCESVSGVDTREDCRWSHACKSFKRADVGSHGILEH